MATATKKYFSGSSFWDAKALIDAAHVLVASDTDALRSQIADRLEQHGYEVSRARCGLEVLGHMGSPAPKPTAQEPVDLIVLDISNNPWVGLAILEAIRRQDWALPVILVTGKANDTIRAEARRLGVQEMFDRPVDPETLTAAVLSIEPPIETYSLCA
jgi:DNA-binding response OmpR family regulator